MDDLLEQLDRHLASPCVSWLLGAGISFGAGIPLMVPLTRRLLDLMAGTKHAALLDKVRADLPPDAHIEHLLSHLGDFAALAERSLSKTTAIGSRDQIEKAHREIVTQIATTIRWGYRAATATTAEDIGRYDRPLVSVAGHSKFVGALFSTQQAGLHDRRHAVRLFTTNYDTLLEDALALACVPYWDGFSGGAVAFRSHRFGQGEPDSGYRAHVIKLHGSIDWHLGSDGKVWRVRDGDAYPTRVRTHKEPFRQGAVVIQRPGKGLCDERRSVLVDGGAVCTA